MRAHQFAVLAVLLPGVGADAGEPGFRVIGKPPGYRVQTVGGLSHDGQLVTGTTSDSATHCCIAFEYHWDTGRVDGRESEVLTNFGGVSPNAAWVGIYSSLDLGIASHVWNRANGQHVTSQRPAGYIGGGAVDVSDLGDSAGYLTFDLYPGVGSRHAIWVSGERELRILTAVPGQLDLYSYAMAISGDGRIVVGSVSPGVGTGIGVVWTDGSPTWLRGLLADDAYEGVDAWGMSTDGNYIVGSARAPHPDVTWTTRHATLWRSPTEVVDLAPGTSSTSEAWAVSDDGETAVGYMDVFDSSVGRERWNAMIWTPATGTVLLADFLASAGVAVPSGIRLAAATDVSGDGLTIAGNAYDGVASEGLVGFVVRLPAPTCYADFNADGGIDGSDIEPFFVAWEGGEPAADVNQDGGVDMGDVQAFFTQWESGACGR